MSTQKLPNNQKQWIQGNVGDYSGNLKSTFNIDTHSNPGTLKVSKRLDQVLSDENDFVAVHLHDGKYYAATTDDVFYCSVSNDPTASGNWNNENTLSLEDVGFETDMTSFNGLLLISLGTDIMTWDGTATKDDDWWTVTTGGTALTTLKEHNMNVVRSGRDTLFVTDGNIVRYYNTAANHTTITLDSTFTAATLSPALDKMWVGTYTESDNNAYMFEIQVGQDTYTQSYEVEGRVILASFVYRNTPFVITELGYIQAFNGAGFETVAQFPWADGSNVMWGCKPGLVQTTPNSRAIHPKGVKVTGKYAYMYVNAEDEFTGNLLPGGSSGVWMLDLETYSLTHRYGLHDATTGNASRKVNRSGPLLITNTPETRIMVAGEIVDNDSGVWMESDTATQGYFSIIRHEADSIADAFESFTIKQDALGDSETITTKYRETTVADYPLTIDDVTWLNATQFTTSNSLTNVTAGHELEVLAGTGAGTLCHITAVTGGTTKTVTVDTEIGTLNETSDVRIDNWLKLEAPSDISTDYTKYGVPGTSTFREYKVLLNGDITVRETLSKTNNKHGV